LTLPELRGLVPAYVQSARIPEVTKGKRH